MSPTQQIRLMWTAVASVCLLATLGTGCASKQKTAAAPSADAEQVRLYRGTELKPNQYQVVDRIWIDSVRSSFGYPTFATEEAGVRALKQAAADQGAQGIVNVICFHPSSPPVKDERLLCYGDAIKLTSGGG
jgi:hypothetical protein